MLMLLHITSTGNTLDGKQLQQFGGAEKIQVLDDTEERTSDCGSAMINKEQPCLMAGRGKRMTQKIYTSI